MDENPLHWTGKIEGAELKQFDKWLHYDLPDKYGTTVGRNVLELEKHEFDPNRITYRWLAHKRGKDKEIAVMLEATHYTSNALTIDIRRSIPLNAFRPAQIIRNSLVINPWTQTEEEATVHGRKLIDWLCDWLENKFGVRPKSKLSNETLAEFESQLLQSPMPHTRERQREVSDQEAKKNREAKTTGQTEVEIPEKRGLKVGTAERVMEMHRLLKLGQSQRQAKKNAGCDPSTYYRHCKEVTAEDPILPYR
jgi:hypothetical protein